ncbi:hypothetical protein HON36_01290 [Candidatus Parcubacteria bacterium]|jgi:hypothetical protein|nr:hypothetical protein [Candidatus Parcubacteria bacterium]MBT7228040.1 hypothetical protein [Candidatus Parcubacteria bacterium]
MSGQQARKPKKRFVIVFYGDEGPQKVSIVEATTSNKALAEYFFKSGAGQLDTIRNRTRAKEEKTFNVLQDGDVIRQINAIDAKTALAWFAKELNLKRFFVEEHFTFEEV